MSETNFCIATIFTSDSIRVQHFTFYAKEEKRFQMSADRVLRRIF
jgi:hypothetical protein